MLATVSHVHLKPEIPSFPACKRGPTEIFLGGWGTNTTPEHGSRAAPRQRITGTAAAGWPQAGKMTPLLAVLCSFAKQGPGHFSSLQHVVTVGHGGDEILSLLSSPNEPVNRQSSVAHSWAASPDRGQGWTLQATPGRQEFMSCLGRKGVCAGTRAQAPGSGGEP